MRRRGFTLIELAIVIATLAVFLGPFLKMAADTYRFGHAVMARAELANEAASAAFRVFAIAARNHGYHIDPDNRGLSFADGTRVVWRKTQVLQTRAGRQQVLATDVRQFTAVRREGVLAVTIELCRPHSLDLYRVAYEYPEVPR